MSAVTAAAYCDEVSVEAFRDSVGQLWPRPLKIKGKHERWLKDDLDLAIEALTTKPEHRSDLADIF
jgi:hypothetical protein